MQILKWINFFGKEHWSTCANARWNYENEACNNSNEVLGVIIFYTKW